MTEELRTVYDSVTVPDIPGRAVNLLCYIDGHEGGNYAAARKRFPNDRIFTITLNGGDAEADFVDCEPGAVWPPSKAAAWAARRLRRGDFAGIYVDKANWDAVKEAAAAAGITKLLGNRYLVAGYDGKPTIPAGAIGHQYLGSPGDSPGHYDESVFLPYIEGLDPKPAPKPTPLIHASHDHVVELTNALKGRHEHPVAEPDYGLLGELITEIERVRKIK